MSIFNWGTSPPASIPETIQTFKELANARMAKGDINGINRLYEKAYAQAMKGRKRGSLEEMQIQHEMEQALQDVLTRPARERGRYFGMSCGYPWRENERRF